MSEENSHDSLSISGTAVEAEAMADIRNTFDKIVQPVLSGKPDAWQGEWATFEKFQLIAGLVQSRTFHLEENNWLTGATSQGISQNTDEKHCRDFKAQVLV